MQDLISFLLVSVNRYRLRFLFLTIFALAWSLEVSVVPYMLGRIVDSFTACKDMSTAWSMVGVNILLYFGLWSIIHLFCRTAGFIRASLFPDFAADIRIRAFEEVSKKSYNYFVEGLSGDISAKIHLLQEAVSRLFVVLIHLILPMFISLIFSSYLFCTVKIEIALVLCLWLFLHMSVCIILGRKCSQYEKIHAASGNLLNGCIVDSVANYFTWKVLSCEDREREHIVSYQNNEVATAKESQKYIAKLHALLSILSVSLSVCAISFLSYYYWRSGRLSIGEFVFVMNATLGIETIAWNIGLALPNIFADIGACKQAFSVISEESYIRDIVRAKDLKVSCGEIEFDNVSFSYGEKEVFKDLTVKIRANEKIGIVGRAGTGKTTFVNLLQRLYDLRSGKILIDGQDISTVTQRSLRNAFSLVPQDPILFHRSIIENLRYGNWNATNEEINAAIREAYAEDILAGRGWDFDVGEGGRKLSKGQRQKIIIARAFLRNAPILILDEATSALDAISEKVIQRSLEKLMSDKTVIVIAHRLSTLQKMNRILVFNEGKIIETGSHSELLQIDGFYKKLWQIQRKGFVVYDENGNS